MVAAKEELRALAFMFSVLPFVLSQPAQSHKNNARNFSFPSFVKNNSNELTYMGNASFSPSHGYIDLTPSPNTIKSTDQYFKLQNCMGRLLYSKPINVWPATFTTTFTMLVSKIPAPPGQKNFNAEGLAFIIVSTDKTFIPDSVGQYLGLDGNTTNQLAIEFDTFKNEWDPDDNHVGIDVKSNMKSDVTAGLGQHNINIKSGRPIRVRIHYDGWNKSLQIYAAYVDQITIPYASVLNRTIELSSIVPRSAFLGFSASTGISYEIHRILDWNFNSVSLPETSLNITSVGAPRSGKGSTSRGLKVGFLASSITVGAVLGTLSAWFVARTRKGRRRAEPTSDERLSGEIAMMDCRSPCGPRRFSYERLSAATNNFSETELLGTGGFGSVYRGTVEGQDGARVLVAVKRISAGSRQGEREFLSEINTIGRLRHRNLVQLQGWCHEREEMLLVYDYMPNGSLDKVIFGQLGGQRPHSLNWPRRHRILCGLASALLYLHEEWEQGVIHRDVKPSNIMLDGDFDARLGDFGLARLMEHDETSPAVTTKLAGTPGYWAPECSYTGKATAESDVFSFGVVVLEVASGRRIMERNPALAEGNLIDWIWGLYGQERVVEAAEPRLNGEFDEEQMKRALILGLACSHPDPQLRPSIRQALQVLRNTDEQMMQLPSLRPVVIYVGLPLNCRSPYSNVGGSASSNNYTASILRYGR